MRLKPLTLLSGLALLMSAASMRADLVFVLTPAAQSDVGSNEVTFTGTLINTSLTDNLFLNNIQFDFIDEAGTYLAADTNVFFANVPGILLPEHFCGDQSGQPDIRGLPAASGVRYCILRHKSCPFRGRHRREVLCCNKIPI